MKRSAGQQSCCSSVARRRQHRFLIEVCAFRSSTAACYTVDMEEGFLTYMPVFHGYLISQFFVFEKQEKRVDSFMNNVGIGKTLMLTRNKT